MLVRWEHRFDVYRGLFVVALLFGLHAVSSAVTLVSSHPALHVNDAGIVDHTSLLGAGLIPWDEIAAISYFHFMVQGYVLIEPRDVAAFARRKPALQRAVIWINSKVSPAAITIPQTYLTIAPGDLLRAIRTRYAPEIAHYGIYVRAERPRGAQHQRRWQGPDSGS